MAKARDKRRPLPWLAVLITLVLLALAITDEVRSGSIDEALIGALVALVAFWMGHGIDRWG